MININIKTRQISGVYLIINTKNSKIYVGSSVNIYYRIKLHLSHFRRGIHSNKYFQRSVDKYGINNFKLFILEKCDKTILRDRERYYIELLLPDYNLVANTFVCEKTIEYRKKISDTLKRKNKSGEIKKYWNTKKQVKVDLFNCKGELLKTFLSINDCGRYLNVNIYSLRTKIHFGIFWCNEYMICRNIDNLQNVISTYYINKLKTTFCKLSDVPVLHIAGDEIIVYKKEPFAKCKMNIMKSLIYKYTPRLAKHIINANEGYFTLMGLYNNEQIYKAIENKTYR